MNHPFSGGVHPPGHKELSLLREEPPLLRPQQVVIPLRQHIGGVCQPLVQAGDTVTLGQKIGDGEGLCVPVHASISGTVTKIAPEPHPFAGKVPAITIRSDGLDTPDDSLAPLSPQEQTPWAILQRIREAGIVGMGGATFPTHVKADGSMGKLGTLILNGCECEPYVTADDTLLCTQPRRALEGIALLQKALSPERTVLALEDNKPRAFQQLEPLLPQFPGIELLSLPTRYPQGGEKQLIQAVTGLEIPPGKLPAELGCAVFNVSTAAAIAQAVLEGLPLVRRIVTVTGPCVNQPGNFLVPVGTSCADLVQAAGGLTSDARRIIIGGPMMGFSQPSLDVPLIKGVGCVLCLPQAAEFPDPRCIRCGRCVEVCPVHLQPLYLYQNLQDYSALERLHLNDCMECGCCSYICPGKLPLTDRFRRTKRAWKEAKSG